MEVHDYFTKMDEVYFGFHEKIDRSNMEIAGHLVVHNEIAKEESFLYVGKELDVVIIQDDVNVDIDVIKMLLRWIYMMFLLLTWI